jgi:hypothetical protein
VLEEQIELRGSSLEAMKGCVGMLLHEVQVCWRMLTYAGVCWRMLTYAGCVGMLLHEVQVCCGMLTYADVF